MHTITDTLPHPCTEVAHRHTHCSGGHHRLSLFLAVWNVSDPSVHWWPIPTAPGWGHGYPNFPLKPVMNIRSKRHSHTEQKSWPCTLGCLVCIQRSDTLTLSPSFLTHQYVSLSDRWWKHWLIFYVPPPPTLPPSPNSFAHIWGLAESKRKNMFHCSIRCSRMWAKQPL